MYVNLFYGNTDRQVTMTYSTSYDDIYGGYLIEDQQFYYTNSDKACGPFVTRVLLADEKFMCYASDQVSQYGNK